jgi:hypothetical protein
MKQLKTPFGNLEAFEWPDILAALSRQPPRPLKAWENKVKGNRNKRARKHNREAAFNRKTFVKKVIEGSAARARPGASDRARSSGRWLKSLEAMGGEDRTLGEICALVNDARHAVRQALGKMVERGLVEKRPNPDRRRTIPGVCGPADIWLYRRTDAGARVAAGSDEWRKPPCNGWQVYQKRRAAKKARDAAEPESPTR